VKGKIASNIVAGIVLATTGGCGLFRSHTRGPERVEELVGAIERVYVDAEVGKERVRTAVYSIRTIAGSKFRTDPKEAYAEFVDIIELSEEHAEKLRESVEDKKSAAEPVFERWEADLEEIADPKMRARSRKRLDETRNLYSEIVVAAEPALAAYEKFNRDLRDHALFLKHDLNPAALEDLKVFVSSLTGRAKELNHGFESCMTTTRAYLDVRALPPGPDAAEKEAEEPSRSETPRSDTPEPEAEPKAVAVSGER